jgi:hypothetical protein
MAIHEMKCDSCGANRQTDFYFDPTCGFCGKAKVKRLRVIESKDPEETAAKLTEKTSGKGKGRPTGIASRPLKKARKPDASDLGDFVDPMDNLKGDIEGMAQK